MDSTEFPSLGDSTQTDKSSSVLGSSWAEVAQPNHEENASSQTDKVNKPQSEEEDSKVVDHRPGVWETTKQDASFADIAGHEKKQADEFPTPQESLAKIDTTSIPTSGGVGDLLQRDSDTKLEDSLTPPNPDRSFADITSHKGFPTPEHDTSPVSTEPPLSQLPDVKDMLEKPSVQVAPVPPTQSFAKIAAKEIPSEKKPLSERAMHILNNQPKQEEPYAVTEENFPTLSQSNLMTEQGASLEEKEVYAEISRLNQLNEEREVENKVDPSLTKSFADITGSNLEDAPPAAVPHVDQHPVYDERLVYEQNEKREERKQHQVEHGNNEQLLKEEKDIDVTPEKELKEELKKEGKATEKIEKIEKNEKGATKSRGVDPTDEEDALVARLHTFDKNRTGIITIFDTILALYRLNYSWFSILPGAYLMHMRLSPMTSPHRFPFIYRSISDLILLPIYTKRLKQALSYKTPLLSQGKESVTKLVEKHGHKSGSSKGLGYWDGLRAMRSLEKDSLRWWQFGLWTVHRVQWTLTYTMLHEPKTNVVTTPTLVSLSTE
ncbi:hypothetical protein BDF21DRAFT_464371 [Thamnidium elegans]|uniref:Uncharacterized protein n=1 Tax=Thamnidium elegans TaxID=101142 RepID=A0A8H7STB6_9FUNG|nr:hypothetical protein INT48_006193 [Thamnidium elegans]KAI8077195.1 hypothetical protein BDF21DRAFT_464371 [Thamnidium elegans]